MMTSFIGGLNPRTVAYLAAMDTRPSADYIKIINTLVNGLVADDLWDDFDLMYLLDGETDQGSRVNLITPGTDTLTVVSSPAFVATEGWENVSGDYLVTTTNVSGLTKFQQNSMHMGVWCRANPSENGVVIGTSGNLWIIPNLSGHYRGLPLSGTLLPANGGSDPGHKLIERTTSTAARGYFDGVSIATGGGTSSARAAVPLRILNSISGACTAQVSIAHVGASLGEAKAEDLFNRLDTYRTAVEAL